MVFLKASISWGVGGLGVGPLDSLDNRFFSQHFAGDETLAHGHALGESISWVGSPLTRPRVRPEGILLINKWVYYGVGFRFRV